MKITGIELIQMIDKDEIKELQKVNVLSPSGEIYSKCYYKDGDLLTIDTNEDLMDIIKIGGLNYYHYEIIEEPKEELEEIKLLKIIEERAIYNNFIDCSNYMMENRLAINKLIANQNKIIRELKANKENE